MKINPMRKVRLALNETQLYVAKRAGVTPQTILRLEQGLFSTVPVGVLSYYGGRLHSEAPEKSSLVWQQSMLTNYNNWITSTRASRRELFANRAEVITWSELRALGGGSLVGTAKLLVVQPSILHGLERDWLPGHSNTGYNVVQDALRGCGYYGQLIRG